MRRADGLDIDATLALTGPHTLSIRESQAGKVAVEARLFYFLIPQANMNVFRVNGFRWRRSEGTVVVPS